MGKARNERRFAAKKERWIERVHQELKLDRHHILDCNHDNIRKVDAMVDGLYLVICMVDCEPALANRLGDEAGHHYLKFRQSRGEHALAWTCLPWGQADETMRGLKSTEWPLWKSVGEMMQGQDICAVCINGYDAPNGHGSFFGFTYVLLPREDEVERTLDLTPH
jgi:hypothetical protein